MLNKTSYCRIIQDIGEKEVFHAEKNKLLQGDVGRKYRKTSKLHKIPQVSTSNYTSTFRIQRRRKNFKTILFFKTI